MMRVNGEAFDLKGRLPRVKIVERDDDFAFQPLEVFERDIKKIAADTSQIEHPHGAQAAMKFFDEFGGGFEFSFLR